MITTYEDAKTALEQAVEDAKADNPDVGEDDIWHDMVVAVTWECTGEVGAELCRTQIGWLPLGANPACAEFLTDEDIW